MRNTYFILSRNNKPTLILEKEKFIFDILVPYTPDPLQENIISAFKHNN